MPRINRAAQFAPFDALKGLQEALRLKEYEHDKIALNELPEDKVKEISDIISSLNNGDYVEVIYFDDGYEKQIVGKIKLAILENFIKVNDYKICLDVLLDIRRR